MADVSPHFSTTPEGFSRGPRKLRSPHTPVPGSSSSPQDSPASRFRSLGSRGGPPSSIDNMPPLVSIEEDGIPVNPSSRGDARPSPSPSRLTGKRKRTEGQQSKGTPKSTGPNPINVPSENLQERSRLGTEGQEIVQDSAAEQVTPSVHTSGEVIATIAEDGITLDVLKAYFGNSADAAAKELGVCRSTLNRRCRQLGIKRCPWHKRNKVRNIQSNPRLQQTPTQNDATKGKRFKRGAKKGCKRRKTRGLDFSFNQLCCRTCEAPALFSCRCANIRFCRDCFDLEDGFDECQECNQLAKFTRIRVDDSDGDDGIQDDLLDLRAIGWDGDNEVSDDGEDRQGNDCEEDYDPEIIWLLKYGYETWLEEDSEEDGDF